MKQSAHSEQASPRRYRAGLWIVFAAFMATMAFSTIPTPLYALYQARDGFSTFTITVIFAAYAVGVIASLFFAGHLSDWFGRRRMLIPGVALSAVSAVVFLTWRSLPGLLLGRVLSGLSVGIVTATATVYLTELQQGEQPGASPRRAQILAATANLGGLGLGPLIAGAIAQSVSAPLAVPFVLFIVVLTTLALAVTVAPETVTPPDPLPPYRPQRIAVPAKSRGRFFGAAAAVFVGFASFGLLTSLAPSFLSGELGYHSHLLAGIPAFASFTSAVIAQIATSDWEARRLLSVGLPTLAPGVGLLVLATWTDVLALFLLGGIATGAATGVLFRGGITTVTELATPDRRAEVVAGFFLAGYLGISVPVLGLGLLGEVVSLRVALLAFAALLLTGIALAARSLLRRPARPSDTDTKGDEPWNTSSSGPPASESRA
jgi:MFS family permease